MFEVDLIKNMLRIIISIVLHIPTLILFLCLKFSDRSLSIGAGGRRYTRTDSNRRYGALSGRHPASIETSRACADYHKHLYMRQRIILAYPTTVAEGARRCWQRLVLARVTTQPGADRQAGRGCV